MRSFQEQIVDSESAGGTPSPFVTGITLVFDQIGSSLILDRRGGGSSLDTARRCASRKDDFLIKVKTYQSDMIDSSFTIEAKYNEAKNRSSSRVHYTLCLSSDSSSSSIIVNELSARLLRNIDISAALKTIGMPSVAEFDTSTLLRELNDEITYWQDAHKQVKHSKAPQRVIETPNITNNPKTVLNDRIKSLVQCANLLLADASKANNGERSALDPLKVTQYVRLCKDIKGLASGRCDGDNIRDGVDSNVLSPLDSLPPMVLVREANGIRGSDNQGGNLAKNAGAYMRLFAGYVKQHIIPIHRRNDICAFFLGVSPESLVGVHDFRMALREGDNTAKNYREAMSRQDSGLLNTLSSPLSDLTLVVSFAHLMLRHMKEIGIKGCIAPGRYNFMNNELEQLSVAKIPDIQTSLHSSDTNSKKQGSFSRKVIENLTNFLRTNNHNNKTSAGRTM